MKVESIRDTIASYIEEGLTLTEIASKVGVSLSTIKRIAEANGVKILNKENGAQAAKAVIQYDNNWKPIRYYKSISESYKYIDTKMAKISTHQHNVRIASTSRRLWLGYHWALADDLVDIVNGQKIMFRSPLDKDNYKEGRPYRIDGSILITDIRDSQIEEAMLCRFCNNVSDTGYDICRSCAEEHPRAYTSKEVLQLIDKSRTPKADLLPSKDVLEQLIKSRSYASICREYGVTEKTLRDKLREYGIYEIRIRDYSNLDDKSILHDILFLGRNEAGTRNNIGIYKIDQIILKYNVPTYLYSGKKPVAALDINDGHVVNVFESVADAMRFVYGDGGTERSRNSMKWKIGNAAKNGNTCKGYYWRFLDIDDLRNRFLENLK